jgi:hypothetical protein
MTFGGQGTAEVDAGRFVAVTRSGVTDACALPSDRVIASGRIRSDDGLLANRFSGN